MSGHGKSISYILQFADLCLLPALISYIFFLAASCARNNAYDGVQEFWILVRETGERTTESSYEEIHKQNSKVPGIW